MTTEQNNVNKRLFIRAKYKTIADAWNESSNDSSYNARLINYGQAASTQLSQHESELSTGHDLELEGIGSKGLGLCNECYWVRIFKLCKRNCIDAAALFYSPCSFLHQFPLFLPLLFPSSHSVAYFFTIIDKIWKT